MINKITLENLVSKYETVDFIKNDPIQFPHRYCQKEDIEIAGFIASLFAYGKRELFIAKLNELFVVFEGAPFEFVTKNPQRIKKIKNIDYRFSKNLDIIEILLILNKLYTKDAGSLEKLFQKGFQKTNKVFDMLKYVTEYFYSNVSNQVTKGFYHLIPNPINNSPMKRMNMFLRWMVRNGEVDFGLWQFMNKSQLLIPLDTHVAKLSREFQLISRSSNDAKTVKLLTAKLKEFDATDPIKYDFALFGLGINRTIEIVVNFV